MKRQRAPKVVVARSAEGNRALSVKLKSLGMVPVPVDTVEFLEPSGLARVDQVLAGLSRFDWVVITSARGAAAFADRLRRLGVRQGAQTPRIAGVGEMTAQRLGSEGLEADFVPSEYTTSALGRELPAEFGKRVLLLRAEKAGREMADILRERGFSVTSVSIYRTRFVRGTFRGDVGDADAVLFGSPSEVEGLVGRVPPEALGRLRKTLTACIGPVTAKAAREAGFEHVVMPKLHTFDALLAEVRRSVLG